MQIIAYNLNALWPALRGLLYLALGFHILPLRRFAQDTSPPYNTVGNAHIKLWIGWTSIPIDDHANSCRQRAT